MEETRETLQQQFQTAIEALRSGRVDTCAFIQKYKSSAELRAEAAKPPEEDVAPAAPIEL